MPCVSKSVNRVVGNPGSCGVIFFSHCPLVLDLCTAVSQYLEMGELRNGDYRKGGILIRQYNLEQEEGILSYAN